MAFGVFLLLGGIGMFLYGISLMSKGMERVSSGKMKQILGNTTKNPFLAMLTGTGVTVLIQSSGAVSVMTIGFINAGLLSLTQAMYIMLGANIGTTITAQIIAFDIDIVAPLILFVGVALCQFFRSSTLKKIGIIVLGFGVLFTGIYIMGEAVDRLDLSSLVSHFLTNYDSPALLLIFGAVFTGIIQSSSASVGILQVLAMQTFGSGLGLSSVVYMIIGMNIGACAPVLLASIGGSSDSHRTALACLIEKLVGAALFIIVLAVFPGLIALTESITPNDISRQIANLHLMFNITASVAICPFVPLIVKLIMRLIPEKKGVMPSASFEFINQDVLLAPMNVAVWKTKSEVSRTYLLSIENLRLSVQSFFGGDERSAKQVIKNEGDIDALCRELTKFLVSLSAKKLSMKESRDVGVLFQVVTDIERVSDHAENIAEYTESMIEDSMSFTDIADNELTRLSNAAIKTLELSREYFDGDKDVSFEDVNRQEKFVDELQDECIANHIERLKRSACDPKRGVIFTDTVSDLERCADHAFHITLAVYNSKDADVERA